MEESPRQAMQHPARGTPSQMSTFKRHCEVASGQHFPDYAHFHSFSVRDCRTFWRLFLRWSGLEIRGEDEVVCTSDVLHEAEFFPQVTFNFARAVLADSILTDDAPAILARRWNDRTERLTRGQLRAQVEAAAAALQRLGLDRTSRVALLAFSDANAAVAALATAALGAAIAMVAPEMAAEATIARLRAVAPQILFCHAQAPYEQDAGPHRRKLCQIIQAVPSLQAVVLLDSTEPLEGISIPSHVIGDLIRVAADGPFDWPALPFNHPLYILFSSGTTGDPKALVHGAGGTLLEHVKEHRLHCDLQPGDRMFFHTSTAWMMWSWALTALASGVELVLYDGGILLPDTLWKIVSEEAITVFGTSPAYLQMSERIVGEAFAKLDFSALRAVLSTGSILYPQQQTWFSRHIKPIPIQSISGGTDIVGCFVMGNPDLPAFAGEPQCKGLGFDLHALVVEGATRADIGELVCAGPFPSRPVGLVNDPDRARFYEAYFARNPGYWTHGDLVEFHEDGSVVMHGRSDGILNIRGIRIGPAEIYEVLQGFTEIDEAMAVEQRVTTEIGHARIVLLVVLKPEYQLSAELEGRIAKSIASRTSAAHVPAVIAQVAELPTTHTGKRSERNARDAVNGAHRASHFALRNPHCLAAIARHPALQVPRQMADRSAAVLDAPAPQATRAPSEEWLTALWETTLNIRPIEREEDFFDVGGNSIAALRLLRVLQEYTGTPLPLTVMHEARTIARMSALFNEPRVPTAPDLVLIKSGGGGAPLFMVHGLGGDIMELFPFGRLIVHDGPVYAIRARGLDGGAAPLRTIREMAEAYLELIRSIQASGPYNLCGYSLGGLIAYEVSLILERQSEETALLALIDTTVDERHWPLLAWLKAMAIVAQRNVGSMYRLPAAEWLTHLRGRSSGLIRRVRLRRSAVPESNLRIDEDTLPPEIREVRKAAVLAMSIYKPRWQASSMVFIRAMERYFLMYDASPLWKSLAKNFKVYNVSCDHVSLMRPPYVGEVAAFISQEMRDARQRRLPVSQSQSNVY